MTNLTFIDNDRFERKEFADSLEKIITKFYPFHREAFVLGLNAGYGSGKTTFLKMWKSNLETKKHTVLYINSWETDFDDEPLIPIVSTILDAIKDHSDANDVVTALHGVLLAAVLTANDMVAALSGVNTKENYREIIQNLTKDNIQSMGEELYHEFSFKKKAYAKLKDDLGEYVKKLDMKPLIIMVDELDRVRPNYAVKFLEAIKHIFSVQGVCFIIAVDREQLRHSISQLYGGIDFENYYKRFVTREANLPYADEQDFTLFLNDLSADFFDEKRAVGVEFAFEPMQQPEIIRYFNILCKAYKLRPRQVEEYFRVFTQFMAIQVEGQFAMMDWIKASMILILLMLQNKSLYHKLGSGEASPQNITDSFHPLKFVKIHGADNRDRTDTLIYLLAFNLDKKDEGKRLTSAMLCADMTRISSASNVDRDAEQKDMLHRFLLYYTGDNDRGTFHDITGFQRIYKSLERWTTFMI